VTTRKTELPDDEREKLVRRIRRCLERGMNLTELGRRGITPTQARAVASEFGLEIKQGVGGKRL
jgi:hypothetical protein